MNEKPPCPKCQSREVVKNGKVQGKQRYKCKSCSLQFTRLTPRGRPAQEKAMAVTLYTQGLSIRAIARLIEVSPSAVLKWIKTFAKTHYEKPAPGGIGKAYRRETGELIDWECGGRDKATLSKLMERLSRWKVELFCTDNWGVYPEMIAAGKLYQSKSQTVYLEQNNGRQKHWFARFRRKSIVVSKTLEMVDLTMALFARFHVNGSWKDIVSLFS